MRIKEALSILSLAGILVLSCSKNIEEPIPAEEESRSQEKKELLLSTANIYVDQEMSSILEEAYSNGTVITKSSGLNAILDELGVIRIEKLFPDTGEFAERRKAFGLDKWYKIVYDSSVPATKAGKVMSEVTGIEVFEKDRPIKIKDELPFDDPYLPIQWHYYNNGSSSSWKAKADINVLPVWKNYTTGSSDIVVGVVDGGIDTSHEDLKGVVNVANSWNFCNSGGKISAHSHGTHVAGTIGAINNNGIGVSGIAGGDAKAGIKGVTLLSCQIFDDGGGSGDGAKAIVWAADHGAVICNNSWGYDFQNEDGSYDTEAAKEMHELYRQPNTGEYRTSVKDAIDYFNTNAGLDKDGNQVGPMAGGVVFFSAGNENWQYGPPANYSGAISVGAYGPDGTRAYYTNFGTKDDNWVDIAAPGGDYRSTQIASTLPGNAYGNMQGTSMACPHVSGVAALLLAELGGPGFTREMLIDRLLNSPNPNFNLGNARIGVPIDAMGALTKGNDPETPVAVTTLKASTESNKVTATWAITGSENGVTAYAYRLFYGTDKTAVTNATTKNPGTGVTSIVVETGMKEIGESLSATFTGDFETTYYIKVLGYDYGLNYSENSNIATITTPANQAPVISTNADISNIVLKATGTLSIDFNVYDPDGHDFEVAHKAGSAAESLMTLPGKYTLTFDAPSAEAGKYTATITATDSYGAASTLLINYTILENTPPKTLAKLDNIIFNELSQTLKLPMLEYFNDPDGDALEFTFQNSNGAVAHITSGTENNAFITSMAYGLTEITITAADAKKASASQSFKILVREAGIEMQAYPTTVTTSLHIATGEDPESAEIKIASQTGAVFYEETLTCSAFEPAEIDMSNAAPGKYTVSVTFGGKEHKQTIVKK